VARAAHADGATEQRAKVLFDAARRLVKSGDYAQACPKFEQSMQLDDGIGTEFNLADCWEKIGRTGRARDLFLEVADAARATGEWDREQAARQRAAALATVTAEPATPEAVEAAVLAIRGAPAEYAKAEPEPEPSDGPTAAPVDAAAVLEEECGSLAEAAARVRALQQSAAQLRAGQPNDPRLQKAERELVALEAQLAAAWSLAGRVASALASRTAGSPSERSASQAKPREPRPASPAAGSVAVASAPGHSAQ
jgi:tetratricopeptide (TPR) repeat protein